LQAGRRVASRGARPREEVIMMRSARLTTALLLACALALGTGATHAQDAAGVERLSGTLAKIRASGLVTIGYRDASVPFSYLGPGRKPIGYSIDLCLAIVDAIRAELGNDAIQVRYFPVNSQTRIPLVVDGTVDLECGSTTNNLERQKQVAFSPIFFVSGTKLMVKRGSKFRSYRDLRGRSVAVTEGTTNEAALKAVNAREGLAIKPVTFRDHDQSFGALASGKVDAWAGDDALLYAQAAESAAPRDFSVLPDYLSYDPYGIMFRRDDPGLAVLVKRTFEELAESRELARLYDQWFLRKLPSGRTLGIAMSPQLESIFEAMGQPTE
jgi:glutamate/aspartate transport system substrate-binding protein